MVRESLVPHRGLGGSTENKVKRDPAIKSLVRPGEDLGFNQEQWKGIMFGG